MRYASLRYDSLCYGYLQNQLVGIQLWIDEFMIEILFHLLSIEFCHRIYL